MQKLLISASTKVTTIEADLMKSHREKVEVLNQLAKVKNDNVNILERLTVLVRSDKTQKSRIDNLMERLQESTPLFKNILSKNDKLLYKVFINGKTATEKCKENIVRAEKRSFEFSGPHGLKIKKLF
jgi:type II secretory pathway component PulF